MKDSEKKAILILIVISILIIAGILMLRNNKNKKIVVSNSEIENKIENKEVIEENIQYLEDGTKLNVSTQLTKTKTLDGLEITNIEIKEKNGISTLRADVENKTHNNFNRREIKIEIINKEGIVIRTLNGIIDPIKSGEKVKLSIAVNMDISNTYDFNIK